MNRPPTFFFAILSLLVFLTISDYGMTNLEPLYVAQGYDLAVWYARTLGLTEYLNRKPGALSGGQRQRVWIAMALAQQTGVLLLDEPTTFLDINHQIEVLDLLTDLNRERGTTVVMVLHDLNLAARYADRIVAMAAGKIHAAGTPEDILTEETVAEVFSLRARIIRDPVSGTPMMIPIGRHDLGELDGGHAGSAGGGGALSESTRAAEEYCVEWPQMGQA